MADASRPRPTKGTASDAADKGFALHLSLPTVLAVGIVLAVTVGWTFFMGFMVGRGQNPATHLEEITGFGDASRPEKTTQAAAPKPVVPEPSQAPPLSGQTETAETKPTSPTPAAVPPPAAPEKASDVRVRPTAAESAPDVSARPAAKPKKPEGKPYPFARPSGSGLAAWGDAPQQPPQRQASTETTAARPNPPPAAPAAPATPKYDIIYQVAAFRNIAEADKLCAELKGRGHRATHRKSGKVELVFVHLRGTDADAAKVRASLQAMGLGKPVPIQRKPVGEPSPKQKRR